MSYEFRQFHIRDDMVAAIRLYVDEGIPTGDFLAAVIDHNLFEAVARADNENIENLPAFVAYFYNDTPSACHGSAEKRGDWLRKFRAKEIADKIVTGIAEGLR